MTDSCTAKRRRLLRALALVVACACGVARAEADLPAQPAADPYLPLFVMYSGTPGPEQLLALRQFLATRAVPRDAIRDTVQTVIYKLKTFRAGFAYPVFRDETSTAGHACVIADSRHAHPEEVWTVLASERVYRPLLLGRAPALDAQQLLENVFEHELFHCYDAGHDSLEHAGQRILEQGAAYFAYWGEAGADAYAALQHLRQGGDTGLLRALRDFRTVNLLNGDAVHYTAGVLDHIIVGHSAESLRGLNTRQLIALADRIRADAALSPEEFAQVAAVAADLNREYETLIADYPGLPRRHASGTMQPEMQPFSPAYGAAVFARVRAALGNLGGAGSLENPYFAPLAARFDRPEPTRLVRAP